MAAFEGGGWGWLAVAVSTDGWRIAAVREQEIRMTESATGTICWQIKPPLSEQDKVPQDLAFVATNRLLAVQFLKSVEIWDAATGNHQSVLTSVVGSNSRMRASRDGRLLAVAIDNGNSAPAHVEIHDFAQSGSVQRITESNAAHAIGDLEFSTDNRYLAVVGSLYRHSFAIWDWAAGTKRVVPVRADSHGFTAEMQFAWSPDGTSLAVKYAYEGPCVYDTRSWKPKVQWQFAEPTSFHLAFAWDGTLLALLGNGELHSLDAAALRAPTESSP